MAGSGKVDLSAIGDIEARYQESCRMDQANLGLLGVDVNLNCDALKMPDTESPASVERKHDSAERRLKQTIKAMGVSRA